MCPRWMPIDPSKIAGGTADPLTLANGLNIGTLGSDNEVPSYLKLTTSGIAYMLGSSAVSKALFSGGPIGNVKTLFGNQSVYGSGNIDLYRHNITIKINKQGAQKAWISTILISSSNTQIGNITDFFNTFDELGYAYPCMGFAPDNNGVNQSVINVEPRSRGGVSFANGPSFRWSDTSLNIILEDTVTTV